MPTAKKKAHDIHSDVNERCICYDLDTKNTEVEQR